MISMFFPQLIVNLQHCCDFNNYSAEIIATEYNEISLSSIFIEQYAYYALITVLQ